MLGKSDPNLLQDVLLDFVHGSSFRRIAVIVAVEVKQSVNEIEGALALGIGVVLCGLTQGGIGADEDFAVLKSNDVSGRGIAQKAGVSLRDDGVRHKTDFHLIQFREKGLVPAGMREDERQGARGRIQQALQFQDKRALMVVKFQCRHVPDAAGSSRQRQAQSAPAEAAGRNTSGLLR
jgi:hypothetical protein